MKKSQLQSIIKEEIRNVLREESGPTEFDFDPTLVGIDVDVKEDGDYVYGRRVGSNYTYSSKMDPKGASLKVARFSEHSGPNNYRLFLSLASMPGDASNTNAKKLANAISSKLKWSSGESSNTGKMVNNFSAYRLSPEEAKSAIQKFATYLKQIKPKAESLVGSIKAGVKSLAGSTEVKPNDKIKIVFDKELKTSTTSMTELEFKMVETSYGPKQQIFMYIKWPNEEGGNYTATLRNNGSLKIGDIPAIGGSGSQSNATEAEDQNVKVAKLSVNGKDVKAIHWKEKSR